MCYGATVGTKRQSTNIGADIEEAAAEIRAMLDGPTDQERLFGGNLKMVREARGLTQTALAKKMAERGFPFHQMTISRIESGERPPRLSEAIALAEIVETTVEHLTALSDKAEAETAVRHHLAVVADALLGIEEQARNVLSVHSGFGVWIARARKLGVDESLLQTAEAWYAKHPTEMVQAAFDHFEEVISRSVEKYGLKVDTDWMSIDPAVRRAAMEDSTLAHMAKIDEVEQLRKSLGVNKYKGSPYPPGMPASETAEATGLALRLALQNLSGEELERFNTALGRLATNREGANRDVKQEE